MPKNVINKIYSITDVAVMLVNHELPLLNVCFQNNYMTMNSSLSLMNSSLSLMFYFKIIVRQLTAVAVILVNH